MKNVETCRFCHKTYEKKNKYFYRCHNCNVGTSFNKFLEQISPALHRDYLTENYKEEAWRKKDADKLLPEFDFVPKFNNVSGSSA